jgi:hypothetical protein
MDGRLWWLHWFDHPARDGTTSTATVTVALSRLGSEASRMRKSRSSADLNATGLRSTEEAPRIPRWPKRTVRTGQPGTSRDINCVI